MIRFLAGFYALKIIIGIAYLFFLIWAIVDIINSKKDTLTKVLWIIVCLIFNLIGLLVYYLFGRDHTV